MYVRQNLHDAMMQLRREETPRTFWIDAICINQNDDMEKSQQVSQMVEIYANACSTAMWLGKEDILPAWVWTTITRLVERSDSYRALFDNNNGRYRLTFGPQIFRSWDMLLESTYFSRSWVTQEIVMSRHLILTCGSNRLDLTYLWMNSLESLKFRGDLQCRKQP